MFEITLIQTCSICGPTLTPRKPRDSKRGTISLLYPTNGIGMIENIKTKDILSLTQWITLSGPLIKVHLQKKILTAGSIILTKEKT